MFIGKRIYFLLGSLAILLVATLPTTAFSTAPLTGTTRPDTLPDDLIDPSLNVIRNAPALAAFFERLHLLEADSIQEVRIVHIGDSHIQADLLTGPLRGLLQHRFGMAGRGLIFPFPLAGTNAPLDLGFQSPDRWEVRKSVFRHQGPPLGICGISLRSQAAAPSLRVFLKDRYHYGHDYAFDRITLFHGPDEHYVPLLPEAGGGSPGVAATGARRYHRVRPGDTLYDLARSYRVTVTDLQRWNGLSGPRIQAGQQLVVGSENAPAASAALATPPAGVKVSRFTHYQTQYTLPRPVRSLTLQGAGQSTVYGIMLDNPEQDGILYHVIGVNGVTYHHYNQSEYFWEQLPALQPDLIIVSLGTNEALASGFQKSVFQESVALFLEKARQTAPSASILLTTNPDVLRRKRYENPNNEQVKNSILEAAAQEDLAVWDLHRIMGGAGSVRRWREYELAHTDYIHFTKEGYRLQAALLFQALLNVYDGGD